MQRKLNRSAITRSHGKLQSEYQKAMQGATPEQSSKFEIGVSLEKLERAAISISSQDNQILQGHFDEYNREKDTKRRNELYRQIRHNILECEHYAQLVCEARFFDKTIREKWAM